MSTTILGTDDSNLQLHPVQLFRSNYAPNVMQSCAGWKSEVNLTRNFMTDV